MSAGEWSILLAAAAGVLTVAEVLLPSHGVLAVAAFLSFAGAVGAAFVVHPWLGLGLMLGSMAMAPLAWGLFLKIWPKLPIGKRVILPPVEPSDGHAPVGIGETGMTVSELRPMGVCEFAGVRVEAKSDVGIVASGERVVVVGLNNRRPIVRKVGQEA